jgi:AcrR family transcriptional regulator
LAGRSEVCKIERPFDFSGPLTRRRRSGRNRHRSRLAAGLTAVNDAAALRRPSRPLQKGLQTRATIIEAALALAANKGLEGLSIGSLAEVTGMSKSGVFAHFGSREELQISVIRDYHVKFEEEVFLPSIREPRGLPRLRAMFERWLRRVSYEIDSGCIYISGAVEFDDRPGPVRDALATMVQTWQDALTRAIRMAVDEGHLSPDTEPEQVMFEIHGLILALHHDARFLRNPRSVERARHGFERVLAHSIRSAPHPLPAPAEAPAPPSREARPARR